MDYKFHPLIKYGFFSILIFAIFKYENIVPTNMLLQIVGTCVVSLIILDMILIRNHPPFINFDEKEEIIEVEQKETKTEDEPIIEEDVDLQN